MRKIYSLVLLAAALLVGTTAWADYSPSWLQDQFDDVPADGQTHTITMQDNIVLTDPVYLGTASVDDPRKSIILDMNGHHITMDATTWVTTKGNVFCSMFTITHGELLIRNNNKSVTSTISMTGKGYDYIGSDSKRQLAQYNNIFNVAGSYKSSRWVKSGNTYVIDENAAINTRDAGWFTHLEIGEGVKVVAENTIYGAGISIDGYYTNYHAMISKDATATTGVFDASLNGSFGNVCLYNRTDAPAYNTVVLAGSAGEGVAYGVRVDVYGDIEFATAATEGKAYGIKLNGGLKSSLKAGETFWKKHCWSVDQAYAATYGATSTSPDSYPIGDDAYEAHKLDTVDAPFLYIHNTAHIIAAAELNEATAVYCSGYGKTLIEGACSGNSGVNIKSGTVELHDAEITGTASNYENAEQGNHATGSGGIVVNSVDNRAGGIEVVISGDTKVSTTVGYAIEEVVNKTGGGSTDVSSIDIQGGTIEGGNLGAIALTTEGADATQVTGGNSTGSVKVNNQDVDVSDLVPQNQDYHTTTVTDGNKTIIVVSTGAAPTGQDDVAGENNVHEGTAVNWKHTTDPDPGTDMSETLISNLTLTELEINQSYNQTLIIGDPENANPAKQKVTLTVGRVVLGENAQIIVNPGSKLIVNGNQGIVAPSTSNIILKTNETTPAEFLFKPSVSSNRHPNATVQLIANSYTSASAPTVDYLYQRFGVPTYTAVKAVSAKNPSTCEDIQVFFRKYQNNGWIALGYINVPGQSLNLSKLNDPFGYYSLQCNTPNVGTIVSMSGELVGNVDATLTTGQNTNGWSTYANSYTAQMSAEAMMNMFNGLPEGTNAAVYIQKNMSANDNSFDWFTYDKTAALFLGGMKLNPMQAFLIKDPDAAVTTSLALNYETMVWNPGTSVAPAPARVATQDMTMAAIKVYNSENVQKDAVYMIESDQFSADIEKGYDSEKYMGSQVKLYIMNDAKYATCATDDLNNTYLGFSCAETGMYTLSFEHIAGKALSMVDLKNNTVINIVEGATYQFYADENENDYRFKIINRQELPTDLESVNTTNNVKANGIYTITGQYLGNMSVWNTLPAGIYVVDGVKKIK